MRFRTRRDAEVCVRPLTGDALVSNDNTAQPATNLPKQATAGHRLRRHAEYQRVYREGRKQSSASMSYFFALRAASSPVPAGPRVGLTAGRVLGKAVERNRIKRRMREVVRRQIGAVRANVDIVLHPRKAVLTAEFAKLEREVARIFNAVQTAAEAAARTKAEP